MSFRFSQNKDCEFFSCHMAERPEDFNCRFCFCPLYYFEDCGGNFSYYKGLKDCSTCLIPHEDYDYIIEKIVDKNRELEKSKSLSGGQDE